MFEMAHGSTPGTTWDYRTKLEVNGRIKWPNGSYSVTTAHGRRVIRFNDVPTHNGKGGELREHGADRCPR
jgi:hypothetical protein